MLYGINKLKIKTSPCNNCARASRHVRARVCARTYSRVHGPVRAFMTMCLSVRASVYTPVSASVRTSVRVCVRECVAPIIITFIRTWSPSHTTQIQVETKIKERKKSRDLFIDRLDWDTHHYCIIHILFCMSKYMHQFHSISHISDICPTDWSILFNQ